MRKLNKQKRIILTIICIFILIIAYGVYFYNSKIYEEFEETESIKELIPYEQEKQSEELTKEENITQEIDELNENIVVHITGAVKNWGIVELPVNSRICDAIEKAGGLTEDADIEKINLAFVLEDGMKIKIPSINQPIDDSYNYTHENYISKDGGQDIVIESGSNKSQNKKTSIVNINKATQTELETLPGIGTSTALKIINYRNENGKFENIEDLKKVNGIGEAKYDKIKSLICI